MAGKAKSVHLSVTHITTHKVVLTRTFFVAADLNAYIKTPEFLELYPPEIYSITKEIY